MAGCRPRGAGAGRPGGRIGRAGRDRTADDENFGSLFMDASQSNPLDNSVTINPGEKVTFNYPTGNSVHNVAFTNIGPLPPTCVQTVARRASRSWRRRRSPAFGQPPGWAGECTFRHAGTYSFFCRSTPNMVGTVVVAEASNTAPTVTAGRTPTGDVPRNTSVAFTATGTDADGDTLTYAWDFADGQTSTQQNPNHSFDTRGHVRRQGDRHDGKGGTGSATLNVTVTQPNRAPTVTAGRTPTATSRPAPRSRSPRPAPTLDGDTFTYSWDFGDSTPTSTTQNPSHTYAAAGSFTAKVTVSDGKGGTGEATVPVTRDRGQHRAGGHRLARARG